MVCDLALDQEIPLCQGCLDSIPRISLVCRVCGVSLPEPLVCGECLKKPPAFDQVVAATAYDGIMSKLVMRLKFGDDLVCADVLGSLLADKIVDSSGPMPGLLIPVPLHRRRIFKRGYNQALEIARVLSKRFDIPIDYQSCVRIRHTKAQARLLKSLRSHNVRGAFAVNKSMMAKHVAIIDDVVTTGNTVNEFAAVLKRAGVERVEVWCCARVS